MSVAEHRRAAACCSTVWIAGFAGELTAGSTRSFGLDVRSHDPAFARIVRRAGISVYAVHFCIASSRSRSSDLSLVSQTAFLISATRAFAASHSQAVEIDMAIKASWLSATTSLPLTQFHAKTSIICFVGYCSNATVHQRPAWIAAETINRLCFVPSGQRCCGNGISKPVFTILLAVRMSAECAIMAKSPGQLTEAARVRQNGLLFRPIRPKPRGLLG